MDHLAVFILFFAASVKPTNLFCPADFIQKLVSENKRLDAIRFIHAFEQLDKFSPVPLLKEHLKFAKKDVSCKRGQDRLSAQV